MPMILRLGIPWAYLGPIDKILGDNLNSKLGLTVPAGWNTQPIGRSGKKNDSVNTHVRQPTFTSGRLYEN